MYDITQHLGKLSTALERQGRSYDANTITHAITEIERLRAQSVGGDVGSAAARDVLTERRRQVEAEGWTPENDDQHTHGQLVHAAISYAAASTARGSKRAMVSIPNKWWPWMFSWWKPTTPRRDLVKSAALLVAEIERIDRATARVNVGADVGSAATA